MKMSKTKLLRMKMVVIILLLISFTSSVFASTLNYDEKLKSTDVGCFTGVITEDSVNVLAIDEKATNFLIVVEGKTQSLIANNNYGWGTVTLKGLEKNTEYKCFAISYRKDGTRIYSDIQTFKTKGYSKENEITITEYTVDKNSIIVSTIANETIGNIHWFLNEEYRGATFSTKAGFKNLIPNTEYIIIVKTTMNGDISDKIVVNTNSNGDIDTYSRQNNVFIKVAK